MTPRTKLLLALPIIGVFVIVLVYFQLFSSPVIIAIIFVAWLAVSLFNRRKFAQQRAQKEGQRGSQFVSDLPSPSNRRPWHHVSLARGLSTRFPSDRRSRSSTSGRCAPCHEGGVPDKNIAHDTPESFEANLSSLGPAGDKGRPGRALSPSPGSPGRRRRASS